MKNSPTNYDFKAWEEIQQWENRSGGPLARIGKALDVPFTWVGERILNNRIGRVASKTIEGIVEVLNDAASWSVRTEGVYKRFRSEGHDKVHSADDILSLTLDEVDVIARRIGIRYKAVAGVGGAAAGATGLPGLIIDIPSLLAMNMRAIGEYCTYYGFDLGSQAEKMFVTQILMAASSPTNKAKYAELITLSRIAKDVARRRTWKELEGYFEVKGFRRIAQTLGVRLTKRKLAQIIPITGAVIGAGINYNYTSNVTKTAYFMYRKRFLLEKYGDIFADGDDATLTDFGLVDMTH